MRTKILILGLIFLVLIACKKGIENPYSPELPDPTGLPVIEYFTENWQGSVTQGDSWSSMHILSWSVTNARIVSIDQGIGEVPLVGMEHVTIRMTTTYTLTAENDKGQKTASCTAVPKESDGYPASLLEVDITTIPELPVFTYYPDSDTSKLIFTIVITETNGEVGGSFDGEIRSMVDTVPYTCFDVHPLEWRTIEALGTVTYDCNIEVKCKPDIVQVYIDGIDTMGRGFQKLVNLSFIWVN